MSCSSFAKCSQSPPFEVKVLSEEEDERALQQMMNKKQTSATLLMLTGSFLTFIIGGLINYLWMLWCFRASTLRVL